MVLKKVNKKIGENIMREKYFEDLGLDDGQDILSKLLVFKIESITENEILEESKEHEDKKQKDAKENEKKDNK